MPRLGQLPKAAYRFLSNEHVNEADILSGHFAATRKRIAAAGQAPVLMLHDTTEFSWQRDSAQAIGVLGTTNSGRDAKGAAAPPHRLRHPHAFKSGRYYRGPATGAGGHQVLDPGPKFKGTRALKRSVNPTRVPIEQKESICWLQNVRQASVLFEQPEQCVHIGDRGSDIYELFCEAHDAGSHFLFRACADRLAVDGTQTVATYMQRARCRGLHRLEVRDSRRTSRAQAVEKLDWYAQRWKIETLTRY